MNHSSAREITRFEVDGLRVRVHHDRAAAGQAAAAEVAAAITSRTAERGVARVVFAAAPSQDEFLAALVAHKELDWKKLVAFHMDEYFGLPAGHGASFRTYLDRHLFKPAGLNPDQLRLIPGEQTDNPLRVCLDYAMRLRAEPPDIVCAGIGENGHLAFNDPGVADFLDPVSVKIARLDPACRAQQVHDGGFARLEDVPTHAYTLTIPALMAANVISVVVPGPRKAAAVRAVLHAPIDESCPATVLRRHPNAVLWLDRASAAQVL